MITKETLRNKLPGYKNEVVLVTDYFKIDDETKEKRLTIVTEIKGCFDELIYFNYFVIQSEAVYRIEKTFDGAIKAFLDAPFCS